MPFLATGLDQGLGPRDTFRSAPWEIGTTLLIVGNHLESKPLRRRPAILHTQSRWVGVETSACESREGREPHDRPGRVRSQKAPCAASTGGLGAGRAVAPGPATGSGGAHRAFRDRRVAVLLLAAPHALISTGVSCSPWSPAKKVPSSMKPLRAGQRSGGALQIAPSPHVLEIRRRPLDP